MKKHLLKYACVLPFCVSASNASINEIGEIGENIINKNATFKIPYLTECSEIFSTNSLNKICERVGAINSQTLLVTDIDRTIAMQTTAALAPENGAEYDAVESEYLKENPDAMLKYDELEAHLYETFDEILVDEEWLEFLDTFRDYGGRVVALTALKNCKMGKEMLIDIRYRKLMKLGVDFAESFPNIKPFPISVDESINSMKTEISSYYSNGIITTRPYTKDAPFLAFIKKTGLQVKKVVFIDDCIENVYDMERACLAEDIQFIGIHYTAAKQLKLKHTFSKPRLKFQFDFLSKYKRFPSDAEAEKLMAQEKATTKDEKPKDTKSTENSENTTPTETEKSQPHEEDKKEENTINEEVKNEK